MGDGTQECIWARVDDSGTVYEQIIEEGGPERGSHSSTSEKPITASTPSDAGFGRNSSRKEAKVDR